MRLSVVIVSYNVKCFLEQCLLSVNKALSGIESEIIVVDNGSGDGTPEYIKPRFPAIHWLPLPENPGFAAACNRGLRMASGQFVLFLNPDTIVAEDTLRQCLDFFDNHKDCGILGVRMIDGSGVFLPESKRNLPSPCASFFKIFGLSKLFPSSPTINAYYHISLSETQTGAVDVLSGAFMMMSRQLALQLNGFDEDYFMYGEDIDLCFRVLKMGYRNYYLGNACILHFKGESSKRDSASYIRNFYGAMSLFVKKHHKGFSSYFFRWGIAWAKAVANAKRLFKASILPQSKISSINLTVMGDLKDEQRALAIFDQAGIKVLSSSYIQPSVSANDSSEWMGQLIGIKTEYVVWCEGVISFENILEGVSSLPAGTISLIMASGAVSIVGSNRKHANGISLCGLS